MTAWAQKSCWRSGGFDRSPRIFRILGNAPSTRAIVEGFASEVLVPDDLIVWCCVWWLVAMPFGVVLLVVGGVEEKFCFVVWVVKNSV